MSGCFLQSRYSVRFLLLLLLCPGLLFAQEKRHDPYPKNPFFTESREAIPRRDTPKAIRNAELQNYHNGTSFFQSRPDFINPWSRGIEKDGDTYKPTQRIEPARKVVHLNYLAPMEGQLAGMKAGAYAELLDKGLEGALTEYNITLTQTEPAIAAGMHNSYMQAGIALSNRYMAEDNFNEQLKAHPHAREQVTSAYNSCIYRHLHGITKDPSTKKKKKSWIEAVALCSGDNLEDPDEGFKKGALANAPGDQWEGHDHPDQNKNLSVPKDNERNVIRVVDMLFGQLLKDAEDPKFGSSYSDIEKQRTAWLEWFGDYEIHTDKEFGSSRTLHQKRIQAKEDASAVIQKIQDDRYEDVLGALEKLCEARKNMITDEESLVQADEKDPWKFDSGDANKVPDYLIHKLSTQGAPFNSLIGEAMLNTWVNRHISSKTVGGKIDNSLSKMKCSDIGPSGKCDADKVTLAGNEAYLDTCTGYWRYASLVGVGQYLSSLRAAERFVMERTSGLKSSELRGLGLSMIYDTAKTDDLEGIQVQNLVKIEEIKQLFLAAEAQTSGSGSFSSTIKNKDPERMADR